MSMFLQGHQIIEGIDLRQTAGVDDAHKEVADICPMNQLNLFDIINRFTYTFYINNVFTNLN